MADLHGDFVGSFPLTVVEQRGILISNDDTKELRSKGRKCLIGRLGEAKKINKDAFKTLLTRIWRLRGSVFFKEIHDNLWVFEFSEEEDLRRVVDGHLWSYEHTLLVLNEFDGKTPPSQMEFSLTPIWIQIHNMPLGCMNRSVGKKIGETLSCVEEVAIAKHDVGWGRSLRIRVAINLYQPVERDRALLLTDKSCCVSFKNEKLPAFCYRCGRILHVLKGCTMRT